MLWKCSNHLPCRDHQSMSFSDVFEVINLMYKRQELYLFHKRVNIRRMRSQLWVLYLERIIPIEIKILSLQLSWQGSVIWVDWGIGSGDRVCGFKSQPWRSGFSVGLLLLHFLPHGSIQSVVCPVWSLVEVQHYCGINSQPWKKALEFNLSMWEEISMKKF